MLALFVGQRLSFIVLLFSALHCAFGKYLTTSTSHDDAPAPLNADGSDYPCKNQHLIDTSKLPQIFLGSSQNSITTFISRQLVNATSGSCQISISLDLYPTKNSIFKVLKSIGTGCPLADPKDAAAGPFPFKISAEFPAADIVTIALTWFPTSPDGVSTMHMECIPVRLVGATKPSWDTAAFASLPNMFVANIGINNCTTSTKTSNVNFPDPGNQYEAGPSPYASFADPIGQGCWATTSSTQTNSSLTQTVTSSTQTTTSSAQPSHPLPTYFIISHDRGVALKGPCSGESLNCLEGGVTFQTCANRTWSVVKHMGTGKTCLVGLTNRTSL
ncbi:hypothetical protein QBC44DRAFT_244600 [Cladorrhinum sp. PSN332]|nr:hypothetical protein QBC44DRAFT_244600 [Cladorrhinum sp. PSN332]